MDFASKPRILENCISVKDAAEYSGYSEQYLRRLLRNKRLIGIRVGQLCLIEMESLEGYIDKVYHLQEKRFGSIKIRE